MKNGVVILFVCMVIAGCAQTDKYGSVTSIPFYNDSYEVLKIEPEGTFMSVPTLYLVKDKSTGKRYGTSYTVSDGQNISVSFIEDEEIDALEQEYTTLMASTFSVEEKYKQSLRLQDKVITLASRITDLEYQLKKEFVGEVK